MLEKELFNQLVVKKQNKTKQKKIKKRNLKIGYSSKSGHVETKNKQTNSSCKNNDSSTNNCVKAFNDRKDIMTEKKETLT